MNPDIWQRHALSNRLQTLLLLLVMGGFLAVLGWILWGPSGLFLLLVLGMLLLFYPMATPQLIMRMYGATWLQRGQTPILHAIVSELSRRADLAAEPGLYYIPSSLPNAFTVGHRGNAAIAVTDGLLHTLDRREAIGVLAHEISHIRNNDIRVMGMADMFSRLTSMLSLFGQLLLFINLPLMLMSDVGINWFAILILIFAPNLSALAQLGLSRTREYNADLNAARLTGDPAGLASALVKIGGGNSSLLERIMLPGRRIPDPSLLRTHPPTAERVRRLMQLQLPGIEDSPLHEGDAFLSDAAFGSPVRHLPRWHFSGLWH